MNECSNCKIKFIGWGWVVFDKNTQDKTGFKYCSEECGAFAINNYEEASK